MSNYTEAWDVVNSFDTSRVDQICLILKELVLPTIETSRRVESGGWDKVVLERVVTLEEWSSEFIIVIDAEGWAGSFLFKCFALAVCLGDWFHIKLLINPNQILLLLTPIPWALLMYSLFCLLIDSVSKLTPFWFWQLDELEWYCARTTINIDWSVICWFTWNEIGVASSLAARPVSKVATGALLLSKFESVWRISVNCQTTYSELMNWLIGDGFLLFDDLTGSAAAWVAAQSTFLGQSQVCNSWLFDQTKLIVWNSNRLE